MFLKFESLPNSTAKPSTGVESSLLIFTSQALFLVVCKLFFPINFNIFNLLLKVHLFILLPVLFIL